MKFVVETTFEEIPLTSDLESPGSCSVDSECLQQTSSSNLLCSEDSFIDDDYSDDEIAALADEAVEIRTCRLGASRFLDPWLDASEEFVDPCTLIRENLQKQQELLEASSLATERRDSSSFPRHGFPPNIPHRLLTTHRARVVGWMREVCEELRIGLGTFFAAISILDRYVAAVKVLPPDGLLQLLALSCMSLAVKYHEIYQMPAGVWLSLAITSSGKFLYQPTDLQRFEWSVLQTIGWRLHQPTTLTFLQHYMSCLAAKAGDDDSIGRPKQNVTSSPATGNSGPKTSGGGVVHDTSDSEPDSEDFWSTDGEESPQEDMVQNGVAATRLPLPHDFMDAALLLAEVSLMYGMFQSYEHSTTAMACLTLAKRLTPIKKSAAGAHSASPPPSSSAFSTGASTSVSAAVSGCCEVSLDRLAPGLMSCVVALEKCYGLLVSHTA